MMNFPSLSELSPYYNRTDLLQQVVEQLQKDFNWFDFELIFSGNAASPYEELYAQILPLVEDLLNDDCPKLMAMLYRIDIDEELLNRKLKKNHHSDTDEVITDLILKRTLQKVVIRAAYRS